MKEYKFKIMRGEAREYMMNRCHICGKKTLESVYKRKTIKLVDCPPGSRLSIEVSEDDDEVVKVFAIDEDGGKYPIQLPIKGFCDCDQL